jgi:hypothetical protein
MKGYGLLCLLATQSVETSIRAFRLLREALVRELPFFPALFPV